MGSELVEEPRRPKDKSLMENFPGQVFELSYFWTCFWFIESLLLSIYGCWLLRTTTGKYEEPLLLPVDLLLLPIVLGKTAYFPWMILGWPYTLANLDVNDMCNTVSSVLPSWQPPVNCELPRWHVGWRDKKCSNWAVRFEGTGWLAGVLFIAAYL